MASGKDAAAQSTPDTKKRETKTTRRRSTKGRGTPSLVPLDVARSSPISGFIDVIETQHTHHDLILDEDNTALLTLLVDEYGKSDQLRRHGLRARSKLLFCGPPGCGKTLTAEVVARETGLDLLVVRLDALISSFLGETASNLRTVMEAAERRPCILFFDEFDAIAKARSTGESQGELRRVVNSLLVMIERFNGPGFLIGATNLDNTIDDALWRRFDEVFFFDLPTESSIARMLQLRTQNFKTAFDPTQHVSHLVGFSYAEIDRVCTDAMKLAVMNHRKRLELEDFQQALTGEVRRRSIRDRLKQ